MVNAAAALRDAASFVPVDWVSLSIDFNRGISGCFTKPADCATQVLTDDEDVVSGCDVSPVAAKPAVRPIPACRIDTELVRDGVDTLVAAPGGGGVDAAWSAVVTDAGLDPELTVVAFV